MDLRQDRDFLRQVVTKHGKEVQARQAAVAAHYDEAARAELRAEIATRPTAELMRELATSSYSGISIFEADEPKGMLITSEGEYPLDTPDGETSLTADLLWRSAIEVNLAQGHTTDEGRLALRSCLTPVDLYLQTRDMHGNIWPHYIATLEPAGEAGFSFNEELLDGVTLDEDARESRRQVALDSLREAAYGITIDEALVQPLAAID